jgi:hypothetical protein
MKDNFSYGMYKVSWKELKKEQKDKVYKAILEDIKDNKKQMKEARG